MIANLLDTISAMASNIRQPTIGGDGRLME